MTKTEFEWVRGAVDKLDKGEVSGIQQAKILRTIAQIFDRAANKAENKFIERVDSLVAQNALVTTLSKQ